MASGDQLDTYRSRRNFGRTGEPSGDGGARSRRAKPRFVVQEHDATALHYDFRLEVDEVLKSWAVPKGPSLDPTVKRLAVPTEDHPLDYRNFEGTIPEGEYGGGAVLIWDAGTYRNTTEKDGRAVPMDEALRHGHASVELAGHKLKGRFALTRFRRRGEDGRGSKEAWLLVKAADDQARRGSDVVADQPESVKTGRSLEDVASDGRGSGGRGSGGRGSGGRGSDGRGSGRPGSGRPGSGRSGPR